jgi:hypothetical protein
MESPKTPGGYRIDHFLWATPDLEAGVRRFQDLSGVAPVKGGSHMGQGTRNYLVSLGPGCYLEIIGPDLEQTLEANLGATLLKLAEPLILTYALRTPDIDATYANVACRGFSANTWAGKPADGPLCMRRTAACGLAVEWRLLMLGSHAFGMFLPFFIEWLTDSHPSATSPGGCAVSKFWITHPGAAALMEGNAAIGWTDVHVVQDRTPRLHLRLETPRGIVQL